MAYLDEKNIEERRGKLRYQRRLSSVKLGRQLFGVELQPWGTVKHWCPTPYDESYSSTSSALCHAYKIICKKLNTRDANWEPSRAWLAYWETHKFSGDEDVMSHAQKVGICSHDLFTTDISLQHNQDASKHRIRGYNTIPIDKNVISNVRHIISGGKPLLISIHVYSGFESKHTAATGMVCLPKPGETYLGCIEMCIVGFTHHKKLFTVLCNRGADWGHHGFCYLPYEYVSNDHLVVNIGVIEVFNHKN